MEFEPANYFWAFTISLFVFFAMELLWAGWAAKDIYAKLLKGKVKSEVSWPRLMLLHVLFIAGLNYFVLIPAIKEFSLSTAIVSGAAYGFFVYVIYNLTNYNLLKNWPIKIVIIDTAWGAFMSMAVSVIAYNLYVGIFG